jgi:general secretion pathway protein L
MKKFATGWSEILRSPAWRPARWAAALFVAVHLVGLNAWAWKENADLESKREAVRGILRETFPNVRVVVDAPVQMEREVTALRQQTGTASARDLDAMLAALAAALPPGRTPAALEYANGQLRASGLALSAEEVRTVASQLRPLGYGATSEGSALVVAAEDVR